MQLTQLMQLMQLRISTILSEWHRDSRGSPTVEFNGLSVCHCQLWQHLFLHMVMGTNHTQSSWSFGGSKEADELDIVQRLKREIQGPNENVECFCHRNLDGTTILHLVKDQSFQVLTDWPQFESEVIALFPKQIAHRCRHVDFVSCCLIPRSVQVWNSSSASFRD